MNNHERAIEMYNAIQNKRKEVAKLAKIKQIDADNYTKGTVERIRRMH